MTNIKVLVVGANGSNGQELVRQLKSNDIPVRAMVRNKNKYTGSKGESIELVEGDLSKPDSLESALEDITTAYIVTAIHPDSVMYYSNFFKAVQESEVKNVIKISALGADLDSPSEILRQHAKSDLQLINSGLNYTILRPNSFYQNLLWEARQIKRRGKFSLPLADARQSIIDIRDIAEVTVNLCKKDILDNKIYHLTGPEAISFQEVAIQLSDVLNKEVKYIAISADASEQGMKAIGMQEWHVRVLSELQRLFAKGGFSEVVEDLKILLSREPRKFSDFASDYSAKF